MNFFEDGLSIDEARVSILVLAFLLTLGIGTYQLVVTGDMSDNLVTLLGYEIIAITGVNVADKVFMSKKTNTQDEDANAGTTNLP